MNSKIWIFENKCIRNSKIIADFISLVNFQPKARSKPTVLGKYQDFLLDLLQVQCRAFVFIDFYLTSRNAKQILFQKMESTRQVAVDKKSIPKQLGLFFYAFWHTANKPISYF